MYFAKLLATEVLILLSLVGENESHCVLSSLNLHQPQDVTYKVFFVSFTFHCREFSLSRFIFSRLTIRVLFQLKIMTRNADYILSNLFMEYYVIVRLINIQSLYESSLVFRVDTASLSLRQFHHLSFGIRYEARFIQFESLRPNACLSSWQDCLIYDRTYRLSV